MPPAEDRAHRRRRFSGRDPEEGHRAATLQDPERREAARTYIATIGLAQAGWVVMVLVDLPVVTTFLLFVPLFAIEFAGPFLAERKAHTPWHPHHIAERYGLLVIITLGEVILGTVAALNALVHGEAGWTADAVLLAVAGLVLTFGCWWMYFCVAWGEPLSRDRGHSFVFRYGHLAIFGPLAAMGAGLHVAAYALEGEAKIGATGVVLSVVIPVAIFALALYALYSVIFRTPIASIYGCSRARRCCCSRRSCSPPPAPA